MTLPPRYVPTGTVASGGRGDVQVYTDTYLDRRVAIKSVRHGSIELRQEFAVLRYVQSDHVVDIYDFISNDSSSYLVEEYLSGSELDLDASPADALRALYQIARGIADIHEHGVVHGDIKPSNMRYSEAGLLKIFDFGFARADGHSTIGGRGTIPYMAPELFTYGSLKIEFPADTYAFGVLAWRLFEGALPPCTATSPISPPTPHIATPASTSLSPELRGLIDECLSFEPAARPTMAKVAAVLRREMTRGTHRGYLFYNGQPYEISGSRKAVRLRHGSHSASLVYDETCFTCHPKSGTVKINGQIIDGPVELPASCLLTLGDSARDVLHVPFDRFEPEVVV